jgi:hypothetical protein
MLKLAMTVLSTAGICLALPILLPQGNLIALILMAWGCVSLGVLMGSE